MRLFRPVLLLVLFAPAILGYPSKGENEKADTVKKTAVEAKHDDDDSDMHLEPDTEPSEQEETREDYEPESQSFYPSFSGFGAPPLGHSRPFIYQQEGAYSQRASFRGQLLDGSSPGFNRQSNFRSDNGFGGFSGAASEPQVGLLGSGNFGVIRGGTFYGDNDEEASSTDYRHQARDSFSAFFRNNGHGRPSYFFGNPRPHQHEQFANFRDFADINAPSNPAYSQYVVVYVNKNHNGSGQPLEAQPKNIIERLAMLDEEETERPPEKKLSPAKRKLAQLLPEKKHLQKKLLKEKLAQKDLAEPLLALS